jgi:hypothetical protein
MPGEHVARAGHESSKGSVLWQRCELDGATLQFDLSGPVAGDVFTVALPATGPISLSVDTKSSPPTYERISGRPIAFLTALTDGAHVAARYA